MNGVLTGGTGPDFIGVFAAAPDKKVTNHYRLQIPAIFCHGPVSRKGTVNLIFTYIYVWDGVGHL